MVRADTREMRNVASAPESSRPCSCHACIGLPSKTLRQNLCSHHGCAQPLDRLQYSPPDPQPIRSSSTSLLNHYPWKQVLVSNSRMKLSGEINPSQTHRVDRCVLHLSQSVVGSVTSGHTEVVLGPGSCSFPGDPPADPQELTVTIKLITSYQPPLLNHHHAVAHVQAQAHMRAHTPAKNTDIHEITQQ